MRALALLLISLTSCSSGESTPAAPPAETGTDAAEDAPAIVPPVAEPGRHTVTVVETRKVIPGPGLPAESPPRVSNNNLDVVRHDGKIYLAWRTAPDHYASDATALYVLSTTDEKTWTYETKLTAGTDLREPRFLSFKGSLFLYLARLGTDPNKFEPQGMSYVERTPDGTWGKLTDFHDPRYIPWRARVLGGVPYLLAYDNGGYLYRQHPGPTHVAFLTTDDGKAWRGVDLAKPIVIQGGASETDFAFAADGTLFAVSRNEAGDPEKKVFGSWVCRAEKGALSAWSCKHDRKKYDSPLVFAHDGEIYLVGRRNLSPDGTYDRAEIDDRPFDERWFKNQVDYKTWPKRCSIWRFVQAENRIAYVTDLPSKGDTCFPAILDGAAPDEKVIYNYSSDVDGPDLSWTEGQVKPTFVYRHVVKLTPRW